MKYYLLLILGVLHVSVFAQDITNYEKPPVFPECETQDVSNLKNCFYNQLSQFVFNNFKVPEIVQDENYKGEVVVLFEVNAKGEFVVIYTDAIYDELKEETKRVFSELPKIKPATYNGITSFKQYSYYIKIPLLDSYLMRVYEPDTRLSFVCHTLSNLFPFVPALPKLPPSLVPRYS